MTAASEIQVNTRRGITNGRKTSGKGWRRKKERKKGSKTERKERKERKDPHTHKCLDSWEGAREEP